MAAPLPTYDEPATAERIAAATRGRYAVAREIGRGGMSRVYLAWDRESARQVAIKVLLQHPGTSLADRERFRREALIAARLEHPHIVPCHEFVCSRGLALAVMRFVPGCSLADELTRGRRFEPAEVVKLLAPIADALAHAHRGGVIHRDVKPANILLHADDGWPFLTDFGIATLRTSEQSRSEAGKGFGTPDFMSPEQAAGAWDADHRSDVYSLGVVAYLLLAGKRPFRGAPPLAAVAPDVPARLAGVVDRCLALDHKRRWRDAATLRRAMLDGIRPRAWRWWSRSHGQSSGGLSR